MSPTTKTTTCHSLTPLSYWWQLNTISSTFIFPGIKSWLIHELQKKVNRSFRWASGRGGGGDLQKFFTLAQFQRLSISSCLITSDAKFRRLRGVMKIRFAVTLAVLWLLEDKAMLRKVQLVRPTCFRYRNITGSPFQYDTTNVSTCHKMLIRPALINTLEIILSDKEAACEKKIITN